MKNTNNICLILLTLISSISLAQNKTVKCGCEDFEGYVLTYSDSFNKSKTKYWYVLKFNGVLSEDCEIRYQTSNKNSKFKWPSYPSRKTLIKGETEYVISKNGFFYGDYKDKHRVFSYPLNKKFPKGFWSEASKSKYENLPWIVTTDRRESKN